MQLIIQRCQLIHPFLVYFSGAIGSQHFDQIFRCYATGFSDLIFQKISVIVMRCHLAEILIEFHRIIQIVQGYRKFAQLVSHLSSHRSLFIGHQKYIPGILQLAACGMRVRDHFQCPGIAQFSQVQLSGILQNSGEVSSCVSFLDFSDNFPLFLFIHFKSPLFLPVPEAALPRQCIPGRLRPEHRWRFG